MSTAIAKSVQEYIDETPKWEDGTKLGEAPMTGMQWFIWSLATAGKFFEGWMVFATGVALPLIVHEFGLQPAEKGIAGAATLFGILIGATLLGGMSDKFGRKQLFIFEMILLVIFLIAIPLSPNFTVLAILLFGSGLALGCDYPTAHVVISESIPSGSRGRLVLGAFAFQAVGALVGTVVGYAVLKVVGTIESWRWIYATAVIPALAVAIARFFITQSPHWLMAQGRVAEAEKEMRKLLKRKPDYPKHIKLKACETAHQDHKSGSGIAHLFKKKKNRRATILASVPWFIQDLSTYGIGIFTPVVLAATLGHSATERNVAAVIHNAMLAAKGSALIDVLLIIGIVAAIMLADQVGRIKLQVLGFIGCAIGLLIAAASQITPEPLSTILIFLGFMFFNFMTNLGPNAMTYLIAGEVFPVRIRGVGAGFAASFAKVGAVLTAFFFPILLHAIGTGPLLIGLTIACLIGAWVTWKFAIETKGLNLEKIGEDIPAKEAALA